MRKIQGKIVSDKMDKTRVIEITKWKRHPKYLKYYKTSSRLKAHDEKNQYHNGEEVIIKETRPLSREKRWEIISKA